MDNRGSLLTKLSCCNDGAPASGASSLGAASFPRLARLTIASVVTSRAPPDLSLVDGANVIGLQETIKGDRA